MNVGWNCDWCGYPLEIVNNRIVCKNCRKYKGKDGKEHLLKELGEKK